MDWNCYFTVIAVSLVCYFNTLFGTFVFDDSEAIVKNKDILPSTPLTGIFKNDFWGTNISLNISHKSYRPLTIFTYRLNMMLTNSNLDSFHFHATNIILYIILCVTTLPVLQLFIKHKDNTAFLSTLLFAVHPIHTEVVAGLVGRADILSAILFLLAILLYHRVLKRNSILYFFLTVLTIFAAVLCKETAITALPLCCLYDVFYGRRLIKLKSFHEKAFISRNLLLALIGFAILLFRFQIMSFEGPTFTTVDNPAAFSDSIFTKVATFNYIYFLNFLLLLWPQWLCFDWSMGCIPLIDNSTDIRLIFVAIFWMVCILSICLLLRRTIKHKMEFPILMALSLIIFPFLPASNIFLKVGFVIAERILLLPSLGFCFLVVLGFKKITKKNKQLQSPFYLLCFIFALRTVQRNTDWLSEENLFSSALSICPLNAKVHYNVAKVAADNGNKLLAVKEYKHAIELNSNYEQAMNNLANLLREEKKFEEAETLLRKALKIRPNFAAAWMNLGIVLTNLNQSEEAEHCYLTAISHRKKYPDCYYNLGNLYLDLKRNEEALKAWEMAVTFKPSHTAAWSNSLVLLDSLYRYKDVLTMGRTALMHNPLSPALHFSIANTLGKVRQFEKAEKHFLEALNLSPNNALYFSNLGVLYHRWGKLDKAREMYQKAIQLDPNLKTAEINLRKLMNAQINQTSRTI